MDEKEIVRLFRSGYTKDQIVKKYQKYIYSRKYFRITKTEALKYIEPILYFEVMSWNKSKDALNKLQKKFLSLGL